MTLEAGFTAPTEAGPKISVVIVALNEGEHLRLTLNSLWRSLPDDSEIIVVDDASTDGSAEFLYEPRPGVRVLRSRERHGAAAARNDGAAAASGQVLIFSDAHVAVPPDWSGPLLEALETPGVGAVMPAMHALGSTDDYRAGAPKARGMSSGCGLHWTDASLGVGWLASRGRTPYAVPLLGAGFLAIRRDLFAVMGGFDRALRRWGSEDSELSIRLWLHGLECRGVPEVSVAHLFRKRHPYPVEWDHVLHNRMRLAALHFGLARCRSVFDRLTAHAAFPTAFAELQAGDSTARRRSLDALRAHNDDWFFRRFAQDLPPELVAGSSG